MFPAQRAQFSVAEEQKRVSSTYAFLPDAACVIYWLFEYSMSNIDILKVQIP